MSKVALLRCESYDLNQVMEKIETAIGHLGGLAAFVKKDAKVFVKLNCVGPFSGLFRPNWESRRTRYSSRRSSGF